MNDYEVYGDRPRSAASRPPAERTPATTAPTCPNCGSARFEDGFVDSASEGQVRYFAGEREEGVFGVRRFGLERRTVIARRCLDCSRLDLFAGDVR